MSSAIIVNEYSDIRLIKKKKKNLIYFFNYDLNILKNKNIKYFFYNKNIYYNFDYLKDNLCKNWYKQKTNIKQSKKINLIGQAIFSRLHSDFTNKLKIFLHLESLFRIHPIIYYASNLPPEFKECAKFFKNIYEIKIKNKSSLIFNSLPSRSFYGLYPKVHILSKIARMIQKIFDYSYKPVIAISDPYYDEMLALRNDCRILNKFNFFRSYYFNYKRINNFFFSKDLTQNSVLNLTKTFFKRKKIIKKNAIISLFVKTVLSNYETGIKYFNFSYKIYYELLNYYKPLKVIVPNVITFHYLILNYLCKNNSIKTFVALDGLETVYNPLNIIFDKNDFIYDKLICYGQSDYNLNKKHKINKNQLVLSRLPKINKIKNLNKKILYDFMVIAFQPRSYSLHSRWDMQLKHSIDVLLLLQLLKYKKICVKIKPEEKKNEKFNLFLKNILKKKNINCDILEGPIEQHLSSTKNIIGGISTTLWEAAYLNIPYYIYEPIELGLRNFQIKKSEEFNIRQVARSIKDLKKKIEKKNFYKANKKKLFYGVDLDKINI